MQPLMSYPFEAPSVRLPRMTTRQLMSAIAAVAVLMTVMHWFRHGINQHPYYLANKAATARRFERMERQKAASERMSAEEWRRKARGADAFDRDRFETAAKRHEEEALLWERRAESESQDAVEYFKMSRKSGYSPSELPMHIRREMKPEDLRW